MSAASRAAADLSTLAAISRKRPAPAQRARPAGPSAADVSQAAAAGEYNIWHHKPSKRDRGQAKVPASTKCDPARDAGRTRGNTDPTAYICQYFAKGCCTNGAECALLHRVPDDEDIAKQDVAHDVFGRERHASNRSDMSGVGSFSKEQRTLYVGRLVDRPRLQELAREMFGQYGRLESLRVFGPRGFAFVTYAHRANAEFAYQATMDQKPPGEAAGCINVRW